MLNKRNLDPYKGLFPRIFKLIFLLNQLTALYVKFIICEMIKTSTKMITPSQTASITRSLYTNHKSELNTDREIAAIFVCVWVNYLPGDFNHLQFMHEVASLLFIWPQEQVHGLFVEFVCSGTHSLAFGFGC